MTDVGVTLRPGGLGRIEQAWHYRGFGMTLRSDMPIAELTPGTIADPGQVDVEIVRRNGLRPANGVSGAVDYDFRSEPRGTDRFHWRDVGSFAVVRDNRIEYEPNDDVGPDLLSLPLLGTVMAVLLHRRGRMVLHGSAVGMAGSAVVFVGDKGAGKSTTAAALAAAGRDVLTDDIVALGQSSDGGVRLLPGHAQVKLSQAATDHLNLTEARILARPYAGYEKQRHVFDSAFDTDPVEVSDIFVLARGTLGIEPLRGTEALKAVMRYAYLSRFGPRLYGPGEAEQFLQRCADVIRTIPVSRLTVPAELSGLDQLDGFLWDRSQVRSDGAR